MKILVLFIIAALLFWVGYSFIYRSDTISGWVSPPDPGDNESDLRPRVMRSKRLGILFMLGGLMLLVVAALQLL